MGAIIVFNKVKWKPAVTSTMLTTPEVELDLSYPGDAVAKLPKDQRAFFDKKFKALFDPKFAALKQAKTRQVQDAVKWTEERIAAKPTEADKKQVVATANQLLKQAFDAWQLEVQKACDECVAKAYEESFTAMKLKAAKLAVKSVGKFILKLFVMIVTKGRVMPDGGVGDEGS